MTKAIDLLEQTRDAIVTKLGADHPRTLTVLNNLAWTYRAVGRNAEAIALAEQVRDARVLKLGADHPDTLTTLDTLAMAYRSAGRLEQALSLFQQAAAGVEKLRFVHVGAGRIIRNLCNCHEQLKQFDEAEVWRRKWLAAVKEKDGPSSAAYAGELGALGTQLLERKKYVAAEQLLRECLAILQTNEPEAWATFRSQSLLGTALLGQQKFADAEPMLVQGYQGMVRAVPATGPQHVRQQIESRTVEGLEQLVHLYDAWGRPDRAAEWRKRLADRVPAPQN
jgi:tetratricopeptide (TPR) repeat protein